MTYNVAFLSPNPDQALKMKASFHNYFLSLCLDTMQLAVPSIAPLMCGQTAAMLQACESSDQFKASLEEEHRSMGQFHIDCVQVSDSPSLSRWSTHAGEIFVCALKLFY